MTETVKGLFLTQAHLAVFPPVLVLEFGGAALELRGAGLQGVGPVVQLRQLLVSLQDFVHVHAHDVHHLRDKTPVSDEPTSSPQNPRL